MIKSECNYKSKFLVTLSFLKRKRLRDFMQASQAVYLLQYERFRPFTVPNTSQTVKNAHGLSGTVKACNVERSGTLRNVHASKRKVENDLGTVTFTPRKRKNHDT